MQVVVINNFDISHLSQSCCDKKGIARNSSITWNESKSTPEQNRNEIEQNWTKMNMTGQGVKLPSGSITGPAIGPSVFASTGDITGVAGVITGADAGADADAFGCISFSGTAAVEFAIGADLSGLRRIAPKSKDEDNLKLSENTNTTANSRISFTIA